MDDLERLRRQLLGAADEELRRRKAAEEGDAAPSWGWRVAQAIVAILFAMWLWNSLQR